MVCNVMTHIDMCSRNVNKTKNSTKYFFIGFINMINAYKNSIYIATLKFKNIINNTFALQHSEDNYIYSSK